MPDLNDTAALIAEHLAANGFEADGGVRQALDLIEEAGEMVGAYRRWTGRARRSGTEQEFRVELADVVITAFVTATEAGYRLDVPDLLLHTEPLKPAAAWTNVLYLADAVHLFVTCWMGWGLEVQRTRLQEAVERAYSLAAAMGLDLNADIQAKLEMVFSRGWREQTLPENVLQGTVVSTNGYEAVIRLPEPGTTTE